AGKLADFSRSRLQTLIREGRVLLNGKPAKPGEKLRSGGEVGVSIPEEVPDTGPEAEAIPLPILFEDDDLVVINKPAGMVVHPAAGNAEGTVVNALLHHCGSLSLAGGDDRPGIVHRIDKEPSGCLVVA